MWMLMPLRDHKVCPFPTLPLPLNIQFPGCLLYLSVYLCPNIIIPMWKTQITQQQLGYVCGSERLTRFITDHFNIANILIFQTTGSLLLTYGLTVYGGFSNNLAFSYLDSLMSGGFYFGCLLWSGRYCMPTLNPAVTLAHLMKAEKKMEPLVGLLYLSCEFIGVLAGGALAFSVLKGFQIPSITYLNAAVYSCDLIQSFFQSFFSSFIFMVIIMIMITPSTTFTEIDLQIWFAMPLLYAITAVLGNCPLGSNFFITLVVSFLGGCYSGEWDLLHRSWALILGPLLGSLVGIVFFEYFYCPVSQAYKDELTEEHEEARQEQQQRRRQLRRQSILEIP